MGQKAGVEPGAAAQAMAPRDIETSAVRGLLFDVADVFYDATVWRRWLLRLVGKLGLRASYADFYRSWDQKFLPDVYRGRREYTEAFQSFLLAAGLSWAQVDEVEAASRIQRQNLETNVRALPGVVKTVSELADQGALVGRLVRCSVFGRAAARTPGATLAG